MSRKSNRWIVVAVTAACAVAAAAWGRPAPEAVSPVSGLAAITPPGVRPVSSVGWATNRDVISLHPVFALGYPEYTAEALMCGSLLRQTPHRALRPCPAPGSHPS